MCHRLLICAFPLQLYREELYQWLYWRCQKTVNRFFTQTSETSDKFINVHQESLLEFAKNCLLNNSTEFAPELFIQGFDFNRYSDHDSDEICRILTAFVDKKIKYLLFPEIRKRTGDSTIGHSNVGLAARASYEKVQQSLKRAGYNEEKKRKYLFFFKKFQEVRTSELLPSTHPIHLWTLDDYQRVAERFKEIKPEHRQPINGAQAKAMLEEIGQKIIEYEQSFIPSPIYIDDPDETTQLFSPETEIESEMRGDNFSYLLELCNFIRHLLPRLDRKKYRTINRGINFAILNHGFNINQREIAKQYGISQPNVSRPLTELYKEIAKRCFEHYNTEQSSENLARFIKLLTNIEVDGKKLQMPILRRVFVDDFEKIFTAYIVNSDTTIQQRIDIMTSKVEHQYNINLDEVAPNYLSLWIESKLTHP
jgi:DNA-binding Lrp family transcriptional regulator